MIKKIISGGQTGADQGALDIAIKLDIPHGGYIPRGRLTENGPLPENYQLIETASENYPDRTEKNVIEADGTLVLTHGEPQGGSSLTLKFARKHGKPCLHIDLRQTILFNAAREIHRFIVGHAIEVLNVAGTRASEDPLIYEKTMAILEAVFFLGMMEEKPARNGSTSAPSSVEEAVAILIRELSLKDRTTLSNMTERELPALHATLGRYILNWFHGGIGNDTLLNACRIVDENPSLDEGAATDAIIRALWKELKKTHTLRIIK
jgi:hypothetical protein